MRADLDLIERLLKIAEQIATNRVLQISDAALRELKEEVRSLRLNMRIEPNLVDYEAAFLIESIAAVAYARTDRDADRESRAIMYINCLRPFMQADLAAANRAYREGRA